MYVGQFAPPPEIFPGKLVSGQFVPGQGQFIPLGLRFVLSFQQSLRRSLQVHI
jgi:hypothetical protein